MCRGIDSPRSPDPICLPRRGVKGSLLYCITKYETSAPLATLEMEFYLEYKLETKLLDFSAVPNRCLSCCNFA